MRACYLFVHQLYLLVEKIKYKVRHWLEGVACFYKQIELVLEFCLGGGVSGVLVTGIFLPAAQECRRLRDPVGGGGAVLAGIAFLYIQFIYKPTEFFARP